jgi:hypothetical protein
MRELLLMLKKLFFIVALLLLAFRFTETSVPGQCGKAPRTPLMTKIIEAMQVSYKSISDPDFSFIRREPPSDVTEMLNSLAEKGFVVKAYTDAGTDVSFVYGLERETKAWRLRISMLGKFAVLFRLNRKIRVELITDSSAPNQYEQQIIKAIKDKRHALLPQTILKCPAPMTRLRNIENSDRFTITYWHTLFSDQRGLPF